MADYFAFGFCIGLLLVIAVFALRDLFVPKVNGMQIGDVRVVTKLLIFPKTLNGKRKWLKRAKIEQECFGRAICAEGGYYPVGFEDKRWAD